MKIPASGISPTTYRSRWTDVKLEKCDYTYMAIIRNHDE